MHNWRSGRWLVLITVLLILCCIVQRSMGAHVISERLASAVSLTQSSFLTPIAEQQNASEGKYSLSTCELSAKSLLSIPPLAIEPLFYTWAVLLLFGMAAIYVSRQRSQKKQHHPPPRIRLHLHYCILRD
ncbi:metal resistance protein [Proteus mirabilis]|nr:metal resistance protein [Proteus mirabilis]